MALRFGKLAPKVTPHTWRSMAAMKAAFDPLGKPPDAADYTAAITVPLGMFLNDVYGCCVCADTAHTTMLRTANVPRAIGVHFGGLSDYPRYNEIGEPPAGSVGPAVGNAIFAATGKRIRSTPFRKQDLRWT